ncbi:charged multivesicular body protein 4a [Tachyglossus aculeatus]|uniref:charged multivesicular body protein 4a n=1 Tax=Tachyglossus aculeatus TaxID=9261 RepID=UPI0018F6A868|nr:charged multivesicular body protein 4a [Tachyglossus aculeatus]
MWCPPRRRPRRREEAPPLEGGSTGAAHARGGAVGMSGLGRLFGRELGSPAPDRHRDRPPTPSVTQRPSLPAAAGKTERGPSPEEAIGKLRETEEILLKKQEFLEQKIRRELLTAKKHGTENERGRGPPCVRKKRPEQQLVRTDGSLSTLEFQREAIESAATNKRLGSTNWQHIETVPTQQWAHSRKAEVLHAPGQAAHASSGAHPDMDMDKVDELLADITEQQDVARQISDAISRPVGFGDDVDEDELLEELEQEDLTPELLRVRDEKTEEREEGLDLPSVPSTHLPSGPAPKEDEEEELKQLAEWMS